MKVIRCPICEKWIVKYEDEGCPCCRVNTHRETLNTINTSLELIAQTMVLAEG